MVEKLIQTLFWKIKIDQISGSMLQCFIQFVYIKLQVEGYQNILKLSCRPLAIISYQGFCKKRGLGLVSLPQFLHNFWRKMFLLLYSINQLNFIVWLLLVCEIFCNMCIAIVGKPVCGTINFGVKLIFKIKLFFLHDQKVVTKTLISSEQKECLRWNKKNFSSHLKGFQSSK